jgi:IS30 family transposase
MAAQLTVQQQRMARRLSAAGLTLEEVGRQVDCSLGAVSRLVRGEVAHPGRRDDRWEPGPGRLTLADREEISLGLHGGATFTEIAQVLGRSVSTVSREVGANGGRGDYRAWRAHRRARHQARRPKTAKLDCPQLAAQVSEWLEQWWSPEQIARRLRIEFPDDPMMRVSHETIYQSLFVQGRGELSRELTRCLRTGRARRRRRGSSYTR